MKIAISARVGRTVMPIQARAIYILHMGEQLSSDNCSEAVRHKFGHLVTQLPFGLMEKGWQVPLHSKTLHINLHIASVSKICSDNLVKMT